MTKIFLGVLFMLTGLFSFAQTHQISGKISDSEGNGLPATIRLIGSSKSGTTSQKDGQFTFNVPAGKVTLEVTSVGYAAQQVNVDANQSTVNVTLAKNEAQMETVVVTALGISRKSRTLTYSTQNLSNDELSTVKNTNVLNSLNGKIAGVQVNRSSGGAGGSVRVVLRGDKSTRNSQPLYVIDGIPVVNTVGGPDAGLYNGAPDGGDILSTINPDDIESMNVLKGASASALYGSQGSNGVIIITTKKGKSGSSKINFSSSVTFDQVNVLPKFQYNYIQSTPATTNNPGSEDSWGAKGSGQPSSSYVKDFFQTGVTFINSVSLSSANEKSSNYLSYSNTDNKGVLPTSSYKQNTLNFRQSSKFLNDKLLFDGTFLGSIQNAHNRLTPGIYSNPLTGLYLFPRGLNFNSYKNYEYFSSSRYLSAQNWWNINYDKDQANGGGWGGQDYQQNPYWILNRNPADNKNTNAYASVSLKYLLNDWLTIQTRGNINNFVTEYERDLYATTQSTLARFNGNLSVSKNNTTTLYGDVILVGDKKINQDWSTNFTLGTSIQDQKGSMTSINGSPTVPNVFLESALDRSTLDIRNYDVNSKNPFRKQVQSVFGSAQIGYQNKLFLDVADRNDWSSTLAFTPTKKKGYNYYSVGLSGVLNELFKLPTVVNFAKLRASYAVVGNDIAAFSTKPLYTFSNGGSATPPASYPITTLPGFDLKPEKNKSFEIGTQWNMIDNRLAVDFTYYSSKVSEQYFSGISLPGVGISTLADFNAGEIKNSGFEASVSYKIFNSKTFNWTTTVNMSSNKNKITELFDPNVLKGTTPDQRYALNNSGGYTQLKLGGSFADMYGRTIKRDKQGRMIVDNTTHLPTFVADSLFGNAAPKFMFGWGNSFTVKNFSISFLIDGKLGGKVLSITEGYLDQMGVSQRTGDARDNGGTVAISNAVDQNGNAWSGTVSAKDYYKSIGGKTPAGSEYVYDATAVRLRELSVSYRLPVQSKVVKDMTVGVIANNLFFFTKKAPFDPEQVAGVNAGGVGIDAFGLPSYRSIGVNFKCTF